MQYKHTMHSRGVPPFTHIRLLDRMTERICINVPKNTNKGTHVKQS